MNFTFDLKEEKVFYLAKYFNLLIIFLIKYGIFQQKSISSKTLNTSKIETQKTWLKPILEKNNFSFLHSSNELSLNQVLKLATVYDRSIVKSQKTAYVQLNRKLVLITDDSKNWLHEMQNFYFLKRNINQLSQEIKEIDYQIKFKKLKPTLYFSTTLKEQLKYIFGKNRLLYKPDHHKYIKTKTQLLLYKDDHEIKTNYYKKYDEKDLYTAILIPEYGSWIRFGFQKNTKIKPYK